MKKVYIFLILIFSTFTCIIFGSTCVFGVSSDVSSLFEKYYYEGVYTKKSKINLNDSSLLEATKHFHNECNELERTTYYNENKLWMTNEKSTVNSGYKTVADNMEHFYLENGIEVTDYVVENTSVEEYFITLYDLYNKTGNNWSLENGIYVSNDSDIIDYFRNFCAPCFIGITEKNINWITFTHVTVEEVANTLELKLYASKVNKGFLSSNNLVFAEASISRGNGKIVYDEVADSIDGSDTSDLSDLKNAFDSIGNNYLSKTYVYYNDLAISQVNSIYNVNFYRKTTSIFTDDYYYRYSDDLVINEGYINCLDGLYEVKIYGDSINDKLNSGNVNLELVSENDTYQNNKFTLADVDSNYIDSYGAKTVKYSDTYIVNYLGWSKIGEHTYKCDRLEVLSDFLEICSPGFNNSGTYMTFWWILVDLNPSNGASMRIRMYCSETQTGKIVTLHNNKDYPEWYLLYAEAYIYDINTAKIDSLENID